MTTEQTTDITRLRGPVPFSHLIFRHYVRPGDRVVDATCGNGNDTLLLAELVGPSGTVWAFDIQKAAIQATAERLGASDVSERVKLIHAGHETLAEQVPAPVSAVIFNLGYLPGGDRGIITRAETTLSALEQSLKLLVPGGILVITVYPGHNGAESEVRMVDDWTAQLAQRTFHAWRVAQVNTPAGAPSLILIQKAT